MYRLALVAGLLAWAGDSRAQSVCSVPATRDGPGIIAAAATGCVQLEIGEYTIATPASPVGGRRPYAMLPIGAAEVRGVGADTVLRFFGDAGGTDWHGIAMTSGSVHDLAIDTSALTGTSEQTHAIRITGPALKPSVYRVVFEHPVRGAWHGGDCIQLVGYAPTPITGARIHDNVFAHCDRSGVAIHSGAHDLEITDNTFSDVGDQDIDGEGTGDNTDWLIARNTFAVGAHAQGDMSMELQLVDRARVMDNRFYGRGMFVYSTSHLEIDHNTIIRTTAVSGVGAIEIAKASSYVAIHDNTITRSAAAGVGAVIRAGPHGSGTPDHLTIAGNVISQSNAGNVIDATGIVGLYVDGNTVLYNGPLNGGWGVLANGSTTIRTDDIRLSSDVWIGALAGCLGLSGSYAGAGTVTLVNNVALGPTRGLVCGSSMTGSQVLGPVVASGNNWPAQQCAVGK